VPKKKARLKRSSRMVEQIMRDVVSFLMWKEINMKVLLVGGNFQDPCDIERKVESDFIPVVI
jgi:hypothetical protein